MKTKLNPKSIKTLNELLGMSNEEYTKLSSDMALLCVDRLAETGKLNHKVIADYMISELHFKYFGKVKDFTISQYERDLFVNGMIMRYLLLPEIEKSIGCAAYAKQMSDGLNEF